MPPSGRIRSHPRITNPFIHLRVYHYKPGAKTVVPRVDTAPPQCGNPDVGFVDPSPPGEDNIPSPDHKSFHTSTNPTNRGQKTVGLPSQYRPPRCGNLNLGFLKPAPSGEDKVPSSDQKSFHTSTTPTNRGQKRFSPGSMPPPTVWKPQPGGRRDIATRGG